MSEQRPPSHDLSFIAGLSQEQRDAFYQLDKDIWERATDFYGDVSVASDAGTEFLLEEGVTVEIEESPSNKQHGLFCVYQSSASLEAGYLSVDIFRNGRTAAIDLFIVNRPWRGQGFGKRLLTAALADLKDRGIEDIVSDSNTPDALHTYAKILNPTADGVTWYDDNTGETQTWKEALDSADPEVGESRVAVRFVLSGYQPSSSQERPVPILDSSIASVRDQLGQVLALTEGVQQHIQIAALLMQQLQAQEIPLLINQLDSPILREELMNEWMAPYGHFNQVQESTYRLLAGNEERIQAALGRVIRLL